MSSLHHGNISLPTTCSSLLQELQKIWDEIGKNDIERDKILSQLEPAECVDAYRNEVEKARKYKAHLHQALTEAESEVANLGSALGEKPSYSRVKGTLKKQISAVQPVLKDLRSKKWKKDYLNVQSQIVELLAEFNQEYKPNLTMKDLRELEADLQMIKREKIIRTRRVEERISSIKELSKVMSFDFLEAVNNVHPSLGGSTNVQPKSISNDTLAKLAELVDSLKQEKQQRLQKLQDLGRTLVELWNLTDTPEDEQNRFHHVTSLISATVDEVSSQGCLALDVIKKAKLEIERLNVVKASKMKEPVSKKQNESEEIYKGVHDDGFTAQKIPINLIDSGDVDLLSFTDDQILKAKEQAVRSRKDILEKMEKCKKAAEEEALLDVYERDQNRSNVGRRADNNLKRAEKARMLVNKVPYVKTKPSPKPCGFQQKRRRSREDEKLSPIHQTHSNAKGLIRKSFPHDEALSGIFFQDRANGKDARTPADEEDEIEAEENDNLNCDVDGLDNIDGIFDGDNDIDATSTNEQESSQVNSARATNFNKKKRRRQSDGFGSSMSIMASALNKFIDGSMVYMEKMVSALTHNQEHETATRVVEELAKLKTLTVEQMLNAANIIISNSSKAALFLALPQRIRLVWVFQQINEN